MSKVTGFSNKIVPTDYLTLTPEVKKELMQAVFAQIFAVVKKQLSRNDDRMALIMTMINVSIAQYEQEEEYEACAFYRDLQKFITDGIINRMEKVVNGQESQ